MKEPWCVAWLIIPSPPVWRSNGHRTQAKKMWCATYRGRRPDPDALHDKTRCGMTVTLRVGSERRQPTCPDCLAQMKGAKRVKR